MNLTIPIELTEHKVRNLTSQVLVDMDHDGIF